MVSELNTGLCANEEVVPRRGVDTRRCVSKGGGFSQGPTSIEERNECQRGRWALKGGEFGEGPTSIGERNECQRGRYISLEEKSERESPNRTISTSGGGLGRYITSISARYRVVCQREPWSPRKWIVKSHIGLERKTKHLLYRCRNFSLVYTF